MIEYYLPAFLKLCKLAAAVKLLARIWEVLVRNIGPDLYCLYRASFWWYCLVVVISARVVPQNEARLFRSTSYQIHYSHSSYYSHSSVACMRY